MTPEHLAREEALARWLDDAASAQDEAALREACAGDPALVESLRTQVRMDAGLQVLLRPSAGAEATAHAVLSRLRSQGQSRRVAQQVVGRLRRPARRRRAAIMPWWPVALAAGLLLTVGLVFRSGAAVPAAAPLALVEVIASQGLLDPAPARLADGHRLRTGPDGWADLRLPDGSRVRLESSSSLVVQAAAAARYRLEQGRLWAEVQHQPAGAALVVATPTAEAVVVGTILRLQTVPAGTTLAVDHGTVDLRNAAGSTRVIAGFQAQAPGPGRPLPAELQVGLVPPEGRLAAPGDGSHWESRADPQSRVLVAPSGSTGRVQADVNLAPGGWAWWGVARIPFLDLRQGRGLTVWLRRPTGQSMTFEMKDASRAPEGGMALEHWVAAIPSARSADWEQITLPFTAFTRSTTQEAFAPHDGLDLSRICSLGFFAGTPGEYGIGEIRLLP